MRFTSLVRRFLADDRGLEMVEYSLIAAVVAGVLVTATLAITGAVSGSFTSIAGHITSGK